MYNVDAEERIVVNMGVFDGSIRRTYFGRKLVSRIEVEMREKA